MPFNILAAAVGLIVALTTSQLPDVGALAEPGSNCTRICGGVNIPYPFGLDDDCAMPAPGSDGFKLSCEDSGIRANRPFYANAEVLDISLEHGQARWLNNISSYCYNPSTGGMDHSDSVSASEMQFRNLVYRPSDAKNKFTVLGCRALAYIGDKDEVGSYMTGCAATCRGNNPSEMTTDGSCSGIGCCQTAIPRGLDHYLLWFDPRFNTTEIHDQNRCSYAALVEASNFTFRTSYLNSSAFNDAYGYSGQAPFVVDWAIGNATCDVARQNPDYACVSSNSECVNSPIGGYICNCSQGFQGNPYLQDPEHRCKDIDECLQPNNCSGACHNTIGSFVCCPDKTKYDPVTMQCTPTKQKIILIGVIIGLSAGFGMLLLSLSGIYIFYTWKRGMKREQRRKNYRKNHGLLFEQLILSDENASDRRKIFSLEEMEKATNNFDETRILGRGGHGKVYKGILSDQHVVAIKKSKLTEEGEISHHIKKSTLTEEGEISQFINEVAILSQINHRNIVKLFGCCLETEVPLLVYDFISNGSLFDILHGESISGFSLSWNDCLRIAAEAAAALCYLHSAASISVFHRDVKSSNILLDGNYTAKVSDFGASRLVSIGQTHVTTEIQGTFGYLDPEYYHTGLLNEKSDVYSFGVVLLELLLRKKPIFTSSTGSKQNLSNYFISEIRVRPITEVVATHVLEEASEEEINTVASVAVMCLRLRGEERPTMKQVEITLQYLRTKRLSSSQVAEQSNEEMQPLLLSAKPLASCQPLAIDMVSTSHLASSTCFNLEREFLSSATLPR